MLAELVLDWGIPLGLVVSLVAMVRMRSHLVARDERAYHFVTAGLAFFAVSVILRIYHRGGLLDPMPFLSDHLFYRLMYWSAMTAGAGLVASGLAGFVSERITSGKQASSHVAGLELIRATERLAAVETRPEALLMAVASHMAARLETVISGVYYRPSPAAATERIDAGEATLKDEFLIPSTAPATALVVTSEEASQCLIQIAEGKQYFGTIVLNRSTELDADERTDVAVATKILARQLSRLIGSDRNVERERWSALRREWLSAARRSQSQARLYALVLNRTREMLSACQVSLCTLDHSTERMTRRTVGNRGALLTEKGLNIPPELIDLLADSRKEQTRSVHFLPQESMSGVGFVATVRSGGMVAVAHTKVSSLVLLVGWEQVTGTEKRTLDIQRVARLMRQTFWIWRSTRQPIPYERRIGKILAILARDHSVRSSRQTILRLMKLVLQEMSAAQIKLSVIDSSPTFLRSVLSLSSREHSVATDSTTLLTDLPVHGEVLSHGCALWLDAMQSAERFSAIEGTAMFGQADSPTAIIAVHDGSRTKGLLSIVGESRQTEWSRQDRQFVSLVGQVIGLLMAEAEQGESRRVGSLTSDRQLRSRMKSSLSGILGSLEMLRSDEGESRDLSRYLGIIDASARRINDYLNTGTTVHVPVKHEGTNVQV